ncbi:MAG: NAD(P)H-hydrate dehydratase [Candidatus Omnitrophica bacterium]|nr:NAD(P)H-hydrate dehydratase [Candidatus Omnitrophota bacterium]
MPRPSVLSRRNPHLSKKDFGHVLVVAGSPMMLGASALCSLAAMRSGAGLVTAAVPKNLNLTLQRKISNVVMTLPLPQTAQGTFSLKAFDVIKKSFPRFNAVAIGPGLGTSSSTAGFIYQMVEHYPGPMVVDADALNAVAKNLKVLLKAKGPRILTPHVGEMARLTGISIPEIEAHRKRIALDFARQYHCVLVLKGHRTVIVSPEGKITVNTTGNVGMATAGSGDVLTGMMVAFLAQGIEPFETARFGVYLHGLAGDYAAKLKFKIGMIALDIIEHIPYALKHK